MKKKQRNTLRPSNIGRRTGVNVVQGKRIRSQDDGTDVFDDYWSDSDSLNSNQTTQSMHTPVKTRSDKLLENLSILDRNSVSLKNASRSSMKKTLNPRNRECEDTNCYLSPEGFKSFGKDFHFSQEIGRRTRVDVVHGKKINRRDDGTDVYDDYWTDSELANSNQAIQSLHPPFKTGSERTSEHVSVSNRDSVHCMKIPRSSIKEALIQESGKPEDHDGSSSPEPSMRSELSREKSYFIQDKENAAIARSKMTQTSILLDKTPPVRESTPSKNRNNIHKNSWKSDGANLSNGKMKSSVRESPKILSNSSRASDRKENLSLTRDGINSSRVSLTNRIVSDRKAKDKTNSRVMIQTNHPLDGTGFSPLNDGTKIPQTFYSSEAEGKETDSSDSENSSFKTSNILSETSYKLNRREDLPSSRNDSRVSLSSKVESVMKAKDVGNINVMAQNSHPLAATKGSPFKNRTYRPESPYPKDTEKSKSDSSDSEENSHVKMSRVLSENSRASNRKEYLPPSKDTVKGKANTSDSKRNSLVERSRVSSETSHLSDKREYLHSTRDDTIALRVSLSSKKASQKKAKGERNSRVMTRSSHLLEETEGSPSVMANSCEAEGDFSVEKSSAVLSNTLSSPNNKKIVKRNSSLRRSQYANKSSELLNQKENRSARSRRSANKSEILISSLRENESQNEGKRKSSMIKSPITIKRKMMQTPGALGNSLSKTSCGQNREKERIEISPENIEILEDNRSKILVSRQQENDENNQKSSTDKSPEASESITMKAPNPLEKEQVCSITDSNMKTSSEPVVQENASSPFKGIRRSSRYKIPPLASWRNERLKLVKASNGQEYECVVEEGRPEDDYAFRTLKRRFQLKKVFKEHKIVSSKKQKNLPKRIKKTKIINEKTEKVMELYLHRPFSSCEWTLPEHEGNPGYMISKTFQSTLLTFGFLDISGHSMKDKQHSPTHNVHFIVVKGIVEVVIHTTSLTFKKGDSFIVPLGTFYSISNKTPHNALLSFTIFKIPFFKYQENT